MSAYALAPYRKQTLDQPTSQIDFLTLYSEAGGIFSPSAHILKKQPDSGDLAHCSLSF